MAQSQVGKMNHTFSDSLIVFAEEEYTAIPSSNRKASHKHQPTNLDRNNEGQSLQDARNSKRYGELGIRPC